MKYYIGLDIGTSSVKGVLTSEDGNVIQTARAPFVYEYPQKHRVEISADSYTDTCISVIRSLTVQLPTGSSVAGISQASASGNLLLLDENNKPLTNIIGWQDSRVTDEVDCLLGMDFDRDYYYCITGWQLGNGFPLAQLCYIKKHTPKLMECVEKICMSTEYLNFVLTGKWAIGTSAGTPFYLINQQTGRYHKPVLDALGIDEDKLPNIVQTGDTVGLVTNEAALLTGLCAGTPVLAGTFDHPAAARGTGVIAEGQLLLSCGTSWVAFFPVADRNKIIKNGLLCDPFLSKCGCWGAMFSVPSVSDEIEKYIKRYIDDSKDMYKILDDLAKNAESGAGGLRINPYDECDDRIKEFSRENIARAVMESVGYLLKERLDKLAEDKITAKSAVMAGGPTASRLWVKIIEEILGIPVTVADGAYSGAVGAAHIARGNK